MPQGALQGVLLIRNHTEVREGGYLESIKLRSTSDRYLTYILGEARETVPAVLTGRSVEQRLQLPMGIVHRPLYESCL